MAAARVFRERDDPLRRLNDYELISRYRFDRRGIVFLSQQLFEDLEPETQRNHALSTQEQVLIALRYYATGSMQKVRLILN